MQLNKLFSIVIAAPSGAGKTTIIRKLTAGNPDLKFSISTTTRPVRNGEKHGVNYYFTTAEEFRSMIDQGEFVEWAHVHKNYYGTTKKEIDRIKGEGKIPIFDVDVQGSSSLRKKLPGAVFIFIVPPSLQILESRLRDRNTDSNEQISVRLQNAVKELQHFHLFDYIIVNDDLEEAIDKCTSVIVAEGCKRVRNEEFIKNLEVLSDNSTG